MPLDSSVDFFARSYYRVKVPLFEWKEKRWVRKKFYADPVFKALDEELLAGPDPYALARVFPYGETPLRALDSMARLIDLKPADRLIDLGSGRGRAVFFLSHFFGCEAVGIDLTPSFIRRAKFLAKTHRQTRASFECCDFLTVDFTEATCVYLYGTTCSEPVLKILENRLQQLPSGSRVITVSQQLASLRCIDRHDVQFPWGKGTLFLHQ